ncbi:3-isopropylmalate dehydratase small subunit [Halobacillus aidingensis]|uniref:3-isopropylmalate dehydratase small subunit n=1 Tax=Halobacillus aidingensis TaxID=240303 RepID=A0A1H0LUV2_HALAD|nr:3-isopropylmalate dehydratase small subunit [Halobacillus aidingensis]SDO71934.1 3-isopropylmalate/(R)-2-methylmalate dehydratase small subunit [Halobacillus aidingensis]
MNPFTVHEGIVAPFNRSNVDTDTIIPKQFLKLMKKEGYGKFLFYDWRYLDGEEENPEFILNRSHYKKASILLSRDNFGSGSSREHAVWSLKDFGFRVIISSSFADIFYSNCVKNGVLPVVLPQESIEELFDREEKSEIYPLEVDLEKLVITDFNGFKESFDLDPFIKEMLLNGWDEISMTLQKEKSIENFERKHPIHFSLKDAVPQRNSE